MCSYEEFKEELVKQLKQRIGAGVDLSTEKIQRNNSIELDAVVLRNVSQNFGAIIYLDQYYEEYKADSSIEDVCTSILNVFREHRYDGNIDTEYFMNYSKMKDVLYAKLVSVEMNKNFLEKCPHYLFEDLAIVYYCEIFIGEDGTAGTVAVTNDLLKIWGVDEDALREQAFMNLEKNKPVIVEDLQASLQKAVPDHPLEGMLDDILYVMSNNSLVLGSICMLYPGALRNAADLLESDLYVLPSSIHEVLLVRVGCMDQKLLAGMVQEINETRVIPSERLSNNVYVYTRSDDALKICDSTD